MAKRATPVIRTSGFSIANMRDIYEEASSQLYEAVEAQNPNVNPDQFDLELRQFLMRFGGERGFRDSYAFASVIEASTEEPVEAVYNEAADILTLAHEVHSKGERREARQLFEAAMECDDMPALIDALMMNNSRSKVGVIAYSNTDGDSEEFSAEDEDDEDNEPTVPLNDEDDDQADNIDNSSVEDVEAEESDEETPDDKKTDKKAKEDEDETPKTPMGGTSSSIVAIAAANKLSQSGKSEDIARARRLKIA